MVINNQSIETLIAALSDKDSSVRLAALYDIGKIETKNPMVFQRIVKALVVAGCDESFIQIKEAECVLRQIIDPQSVEFLILRFMSERWAKEESRIHTKSLLEKRKDPWTVELLIECLKFRRIIIDVQEMAAEVLGKIGNPQAVEPLIQALKNTDSFVRRKAAGALGMIGDSRAVEPLIQALKRGDKWVKDEAIKALGMIGDPRAIEPLIAVRSMEAARALSKIVTPKAKD